MINCIKRKFGTPSLVIPYWVFIPRTKIIEVMILLDCKNDTNTPEVLEVWVSEVGMGLGQMGKERG